MSFIKEDIEEIMNGMINNENRETINSLLEKLRGIPDEKWQEFIKKHNLNEETLQEFIQKKVEQKNKFTPLNEFISYGVNDDTLHIHIIPTDVRNMLNRKGLLLANMGLIDGLDRIRDVLRNNENMSHISNIFAVSPILKLKGLQNMFEELDFNVEETKSPHLIQRFPKARYLYQAELTKSTFLNEEWNENKEKVKNDLTTRLRDMENFEK